MADSFPRWLPAWFAVLTIVLCAPIAQADTPTRAELADRAQHWDELAAITLEIALQVPGTDTGRDAVRLCLDALSHLHWKDPPPVDLYTRLAAEVPKLVAGYCELDDILINPEPCATLFRIQLDLQSQKEWGGPEASGKTPLEIQAITLREAEFIVKIWNDTGERMCAVRHPVCHQMARLLVLAANYFQAGHQVGRAMEVRHIIIDPQHGMDKTRAAPLALCQGAEALEESLFNFAEAASWYERCAQESFLPLAIEPWKHAVTLRLLLDDEAAAKHDMKAYERTVGPTNRNYSGRLALTIAEHALRAGRWADAETWLEQKKALFDVTQDIDVQIIFHTYQARIALEKGRTERAFAEYDVVRRSWKNTPAAVKRIEAHLDVQSLATMLEAVGEAEFFFAKRAERAANEIQFPAYRGPIEEKPLLQYVNERRKHEIKKLKAIERAAQEYEKVLHIEPVAPPRWIIAAANRVGTLWATFADDAENIPKLTGPIPGRIGITYEELRKVYEGRVGSPPWRERAKEAFNFCVMHAVRSKHFDENARHCEQWLARHEPSPRRVADELHDTPSRYAFRIEARPID